MDSEKSKTNGAVSTENQKTNGAVPAGDCNRFDYIFKIVLVGDATCGKTSLIGRFVDDCFNPKTLTTIGVDFRVKTVNVDGSVIKLQIWDTAGQERFAAIGEMYYRGSHGCVVVYDITNNTSFKSLPKWIHRVENRGEMYYRGSHGCVVVYDITNNTSFKSLPKWIHRVENREEKLEKFVVGCKSDLEDLRQVSAEAGQVAAIEAGARWMETSSKNGDNVEKMFQDLAASILHKKTDVIRQDSDMSSTSARVGGGKEVSLVSLADSSNPSTGGSGGSGCTGCANSGGPGRAGSIKRKLSKKKYKREESVHVNLKE